jgi:hypothetical protein
MYNPAAHIWHPWSLHRFDPEMNMVGAVLGYVKIPGMEVNTFAEFAKNHREHGGKIRYQRIRRLKPAATFPTGRTHFIWNLVLVICDLS